MIEDLSGDVEAGEINAQRRSERGAPSIGCREEHAQQRASDCKKGTVQSTRGGNVTPSFAPQSERRAT